MADADMQRRCLVQLQLLRWLHDTQARNLPYSIKLIPC